MLKVEKVYYQYKKGSNALDNINIEFPRGTISAVLGESGSGKTTLLMCLGQFLKPHKGDITYDGKSIYDIPEKEYRSKVGIVFQRLYLFPHLNVLQNLTLALIHVMGKDEKEAEKEALAMVENLGIEKIVRHYPSQISGGQAQRVAIARTLLLKPAYVLLDEPTSALDANTTDDFSRWLKDVKDETNFIIVTHDIIFARDVACNGVYLSKGKIMEQGDIEKIIQNVQAGKVTEEIVSEE